MWFNHKIWLTKNGVMLLLDIFLKVYMKHEYAHQMCSLFLKEFKWSRASI